MKIRVIIYKNARIAWYDESLIKVYVMYYHMKIYNYDIEDSENNNFVQLHDFMPDRTFRLLLASPSGGGKT